MEKPTTVIKWLLSLPKDKLPLALLMIGCVALYLWGKALDGKLASREAEIKNLNIEKSQLQRDKEIQIVACEQAKYQVKIDADIKCEKEKQEIHKSYAESARQFKRTFNKNR
jgi:hypothetical protein